jgi:hypothetical protein
MRMKRNKRETAEMGRGKRAKGMSRRDFSRMAMLGLAGGTLLPGELLLNAKAKGLPLPEAPAQQGSGIPAPAEAEVKEKVSRILAEFGDRLSEEQKRRMPGIVSDHVRMLETVRAISLENPDAPATVLKLVDGRSEARPARRRKSANSARQQR